jgi:hypothetical protein
MESIAKFKKRLPEVAIWYVGWEIGCSMIFSLKYENGLTKKEDPGRSLIAHAPQWRQPKRGGAGVRQPFVSQVY